MNWGNCLSRARCLAFVYAICALSSSAWAGDAPPAAAEGEQKTVITADQLIVHTKGDPSTVTFDSNVVVQDAQFELRCARLVAQVDSKTRRIVRVDATGGVVVTQERRIGRAQKATYTPEDGKVVLEGDPRVESPEGVVTGKVITYYRDSDKVVVSGGTRMEFDAEKSKELNKPRP